MLAIHEVRAFVWAATVIGVCAVALWRGGDDERLGAVGLLGGWALTMLTYRSQFQHTEWGIFVVDAALLALLVWIALRSGRYWPIFAAGFHLLAIVTHIAKTVDQTVGAWAYITAEIIWGYLLAFTIGYGAWTAAANDPAGATRR